MLYYGNNITYSVLAGSLHDVVRSLSSRRSWFRVHMDPLVKDPKPQ